MKVGSPLSDRIAGVASRLRELGDAVESAEKSRRPRPPIDKTLNAELREVIRRIRIRLVYKSRIGHLNKATPDALRTEADHLDEIAVAIRGTSPHRLNASELRGCGVFVLVTAAAGGALLWYRFGPVWVGAGLIVLALAGVVLMILMQKDVD